MLTIEVQSDHGILADMNNIRVWKVIVFNTLTLGIYSLIWFAGQQRNIKHVYNQSYSMPSWVWLMVIVIAGSIASVVAPFIVLLSLLGSDMPAEQIASLSYASTVVVMSLCIGISAWWVYRFGAAMEVVTRGRVTKAWSFLLFLAIGPYVTAVYQYYINRLERYKKVQVKPSPKFKLASGMIVITSFALTVTSFMMNDLTPIADSIREGRIRNQEYIQQIDESTLRYDTCIDELETRYPGDLTSENEDAYTSEYDQCEAIRLEQQRFIDSY